MQNLNFPKPVLNLEILNGYVLISCGPYDYRIASASVQNLKERSLQEVAQSIGFSVLQAFSEVQKKVEGKSLPYQTGKLISVGEASKLLQISPNSIRRLVERGLLQARITHGGHRRLLLSEIEAKARSWEAPQRPN